MHVSRDTARLERWESHMTTRQRLVHTEAGCCARMILTPRSAQSTRVGQACSPTAAASQQPTLTLLPLNYVVLGLLQRARPPPGHPSTSPPYRRRTRCRLGQPQCIVSPLPSTSLLLTPTLLAGVSTGHRTLWPTHTTAAAVSLPLDSITIASSSSAFFSSSASLSSHPPPTYRTSLTVPP